MKELPDNQLIDRINETKCNESFKELVRRHEGIFYTVVKKYTPVIKQLNLDFNEIIKDRDFIFYKALTHFNNKSKFSSWLYNYTRFFLLKLLKEQGKIVRYNSDTGDIDQENFNSLVDFDNVYDILSKYNHDIKRVFQLRYEDRKRTWKEIGRIMKLSHQTVLNYHNKGIRIIKKELKIK